MGSIAAVGLVIALTQSTLSEWPPKPAQLAPPPPAATQNPLPPPKAPATAPAATPGPATAPATAPPVAAPPATPSSPSKLEQVDKVPPNAITPGSAPGLGERIVEIKVVDNSKTGAVTVEYLAGVKIGDTLTAELLEEARVRLLSSGLFKEVSLYWEPLAFGSDFGGVRLVISAKDKLSWVIAPIFAYSRRNVGGGLAYGENNAFGHNKKFLVYADYTTAEKMLLLAYLDPQIRDSRWYFRLDTILRRDNIVEYAAGHLGAPRPSRATDVDTLGAGLMVGLNITRRFHLDARLKVYYDSVNPSDCFNTVSRDGSGTPDVVAQQGGYCHQPSSSGWDNTITTTLGYDGRSKVYGVQAGLMLNLAWQYGAELLGTRHAYHLINAYGVYAWRFFQEHNLLLKAGADYELEPPFKQEVETGGPMMRGYIFRQFRGDTSVRGTLEYLLPLFTVWGLSVRAIGFYDTNLTWFRDLPPQDSPLSRFVVRGEGFRDFLPDTKSGVTRDAWVNGLGAGIRMYLKGIVLPLIGVDFAYGLESGSFQWYVAVGSVTD